MRIPPEVSVVRVDRVDESWQTLTVPRWLPVGGRERLAAGEGSGILQEMCPG
jgi:hypothetical protein